MVEPNQLTCKAPSSQLTYNHSPLKPPPPPTHYLFLFPLLYCALVQP